MLRSVLRSGLRLALVVGFVAPPFLAYTWAACPHTVKHEQLCPNTPDAVICPETGGTNGCESYELIVVHANDFGCKDKNGSNKQCLDGTASGGCYTRAQCKTVEDGPECIVDETTRQTFTRALKVTLSCQ